MTDAEIIKALECCQQNTVCVECPMWKKGQNCIEKMCGYALDLINRLQADKEALIAGQETLQKALAEKIAEVERLKAEADMADGNAEAVEERAIKEFAVSVFAVVNAELWWQKLISIFAIVVSIVSPVMVFIV